MKGNKIKIITKILAIIILILVGFVGVYTQEQNRMENQVKGYQYAMDINGARTVSLKPSTQNRTIITDAEGKTVEDSDNLSDEELTEKGYKKEEVPYNEQEALTKENYAKSKEIIEKRLEDMEIQNYIIRLNEETGEIILSIDENSQTDDIISQTTSVAKFQITDAETEEVLMDNNDIKDVKVLYGTDNTSTTSAGTNVYLSIEFNKEGTKKFEDITSTYTKIEESKESSEEATENEETEENTETTEKKINMVIDDQKVLTTSFDETIRSGLLQLTYGKASTENSTINENAKKASDTAIILRNGQMPIKYSLNENDYLLSDITQNKIQKLGIAIAIIVAIALIVLIVRYKTNGMLAAISYIGFASILLLTIRYTNVVLAIEGIFAIIVILILNYIFTDKLLKTKKEKTAKETIKETYANFFIRSIPIIIMSITFCFIKWVPINSFGMVMFWGITLIAIYNFLITGRLLKLKKETKVGGTNNEENKK